MKCQEANGESKNALLVRWKNAKGSMGWELIAITELFQPRNYRYLQNCKDVV